MEQFYQSAVFQSGQDGIDKNQGDKIRLFIRTDNNIELDIPEGTIFEKVEENDAVCLKFYLDEEKEGVLNLYPYGCQYFNDEVWENKKRLLTDSSYQTDARCYFMEYGGRNRRYYKVTGSGREKLLEYCSEWDDYSGKISKIFAEVVER